MTKSALLFCVASGALIMGCGGGSGPEDEDDEGGTPPAVAPVSKLSGSFLSPPTPMHLQFAYYESSMVVEYVVERLGTDASRKVLADLARDVPIKHH